MSDQYNITITPPAPVNITVAGVISMGGDTIVISTFTGVTGLETSYGDSSLIGKTAFLASRGGGIGTVQPMDVISSGTPDANQIKVSGTDISWLNPAEVGEEFIIIAK